MLKQLRNNKLKVLFFALFVLLLILVRAFENVLFYDPFLDYFHLSYANLPLPNFNSFYLFSGLLFRYSLNTVFSLGIIYTFFKDFELTKFAGFLYLIFFVFLIVALFSVLQFFPENKMAIFYIRRFLIQPLFLLLFLPAFYFQKTVSKK